MRVNMHEVPCLPGMAHAWRDGQHLIRTRETFSTVGGKGGKGERVYHRQYLECICAYCGKIAYFPSSPFPENSLDSMVRGSMRFERIETVRILTRAQAHSPRPSIAKPSVLAVALRARASELRKDKEFAAGID